MSGQGEARRYEYDSDNEHMTPELFGTVWMVLASDHDAAIAALRSKCEGLEKVLEAVHRRTNKIYAMGNEEARRAAVDCWEIADKALAASRSKP